MQWPQSNSCYKIIELLVTICYWNTRYSTEKRLISEVNVEFLSANMCKVATANGSNKKIQKQAICID